MIVIIIVVVLLVAVSDDGSYVLNEPNWLET
uniref:Uncharacterized protein n=1 Tax=Tetranychus urticae TaxID=32264 RepID=T1L4B2_TETUR